MSAPWIPWVAAALLVALTGTTRAEAPRALVPGTDATVPPPPPGSEPGIRVEPLAAPDPAELGLRLASGTEIRVSFAGSDPARLRALLARLPAVWPSDAVRRHLVALLAGPWPGARGGPGLLAARAEALVRLGAGNEAAELLLLPGAPDGEASLRFAAAAALADTGRVERACLVAEPLPADSLPVVALDFACALLLADPARAELVLSLARERGLVASAAFERLARRALGGEPLPAELREDEARAARLLLLSRLPLSLDGALPASAPADLLRVVAANPTVAPELRLRAAERAAAVGRLSPEDLRRLYLELGPFPADAATAPPSATPNAGRVAAIARERVPAARAALLQRAVPLVAAGIERVRWLEVLAPAARELPVEPALLWAVDGILPPLLAAGEFARVGAWLRLAGSADDLPADVPRALRALYGPLLLAGLADPAEGPQRPPAQSAVLLALARGLDIAAPERAWTELAGKERSGEPVPPPPVSAWAIAADAAAAGRTGEAELAALALLAPAPEAAWPPALAHALAILRRVGRDAVARQLAVGVALALRL